MNRDIKNIVKTNDCYNIYELALKYYNGDGDIEIDYKIARQLFEKAFELGEAKAKFYLAESIYLGRGVEQNSEIAFNMFCELVDETNNVEAKYYLGEMYFYGDYVERDYEKAYNIFYRISEDYDYKYSKYFLGVMYYYGKYVNKNYEKAYEIFKELIEKYEKWEAKYYIALMYYYGNYKEQDYEKAYNILKELTENYNDQYSKYYLGCMYYYGEFVEKDYKSAYDIFKDLSDEFNDEKSQYMLGDMYYYGNFVEIDKNKAMEFYNKAAEKNNKQALIRLADLYSYDLNDLKAAKRCYETLVKVYKDYEYKKELAKIIYNMGEYDKAFYEFEKLKSEEDETGEIEYYIGEIYLKRDEIEKALECFKKSATYNNILGKRRLADTYIIIGENKEDIQRAIEIYQSLIDDGIEITKDWAKYALGTLYYFGKEYGYEIEEDKDKGLKLLQEAADANVQQAIDTLKEIENN